MPSDGSVRIEPFQRVEGRRVFGSVADAYDAARPGYPDRVDELLRARCRLGPSSRVLEIGAGTGHATKQLVRSGASVVAIEPDDAMAERLRAGLAWTPELEVVVAAVEDVELAPSSFDLAVAATSFHWLDPERSLPKIASALVPGGWLALWWNVFGDPDRPDPFHEATEPLLRSLVPSPGAGAGRVEYGLDVDARRRELSSNGFRDVEHEAVRWTLSLDASQTRRLYSTFSNIARLPGGQRAWVLDELGRIATMEFGDHVECPMVTPIYTAPWLPR
jgi:SAM-dependent methyltransferase